jgi:protein transport protein SEC61 subunit gamma-like protein
MMFLNRCEKPDKKEFFKISGSCAVGFLVMGIIGYCIKLVFIPINNIILN